MQDTLIEPLRSVANKLIGLNMLIGRKDLIKLEKLPSFDAWKQDKAGSEIQELATTPNETSITVSFNQHLKKLESDLMKSISVSQNIIFNEKNT